MSSVPQKQTSQPQNDITDTFVDHEIFIITGRFLRIAAAIFCFYYIVETKWKMMTLVSFKES